jgi:hypothetical protein
MILFVSGRRHSVEYVDQIITSSTNYKGTMIDLLAARFGPEPPWDQWRNIEWAKGSA